MKVLIVGSGGREHILGWKIAKSPKVKKICFAPGNGGTWSIGENVDIKPEDISGLVNYAKKEKIDLTVVGPEDPLASGIVDRFWENGLRLFGPSEEAVKIESSKVFAKELMRKNKIPTSDFEVFSNDVHDDYGNVYSAMEYINKNWTDDNKYVIKGDGLAGGKASIVRDTRDDALNAIERLMTQKEFGDAGNSIIIEKRLYGPELSYIGFVDGETFIKLAPSQDHKPIGEGDTGKNTGGMGAYSPVPIVGEKLCSEIEKNIMIPTIKALEKEGYMYEGVLYGGLMITDEGPKVIEFNGRFGDPETQATVLRMMSDIVPYLEACIDGGLNELPPIIFDNKYAVCVVLASGGYPGPYDKGKLITGLKDVEKLKDVYVFHAGTKMEDGKFYTNGGRVLGVTALGDTAHDAVDLAYAAANIIKFDGMYFRKDIGYRLFE